MLYIHKYPGEEFMAIDVYNYDNQPRHLRIFVRHGVTNTVRFNEKIA